MKFLLSRGHILSIASNEDVYTRGEYYYKQGNILDLEFVELGAETLVVSSVKGNYHDYKASLLFDADGRLKKYVCSCQSSGIWRGACKHVVACMFAIIDENGLSLISAKHQRVARALTAEFEKQVFGELDREIPMEAEKLNNVSLVPTLHLDRRTFDMSVTFAVGLGKKYVIRDIGEFIGNVREERTATYGKKLNFRHSFDSFDDGSKRLLKFIENEYVYYSRVAEQALRSSYYYQHLKKNERALPLFGSRFDDFFDMYANSRLNVDIGDEGSLALTLIPHGPDFNFKLDTDGDKLVLSSTNVRILIIAGGQWEYLLIEPYFYRVSKEYADTLRPLLNACFSFETKSVEITGDERRRFLSLVLPKLRRLGMVEATPAAEAEIGHAELVSRAYFDAEDKAVLCKLMFCYGDTEINPVFSADADAVRDVAQEHLLLRTLAGWGFAADPKRGAYTLSDDEAVYDFYRSGLDRFREVSEVFVTDEFERKSLKRPAVKSRMGVRISGNLLELSLDTAMYTLGELVEALEAYNQKKRFHRLKNGQFINFEDEDVNMALDIITTLDVNKKSIKNGVVKLPKYRALLLDDITEGSDFVRKDENFRSLAADFKRDGELEFLPPEAMRETMRAYQLIGYNWLKVLAHYGFGGILADDMGLGKTIQAIAVLLGERGGEPSIVVAPTSVIYNWEQEIKKFAPQLRSLIINGLPARRKELLETPDIDVFITTYDMLKRDIDNYGHKKFKYVIADEAQNIKNPQTQNALSLKRLDGRTRFALTGTPMENSMNELWSIFDFVMPGYLYTASKFAKFYEIPIVRNDDRDRADLLRRQIAPFILRRLKNDVLSELPDKTETTLYAQMTDEQLKLYTANLLKARGELEEFESEGVLNRNRIRILAALTRLRQICCHPALFTENYAGGSGKLDLAIETVTAAIESGHRILLFSQFTSMLAILKGALEQSGTAYFYLDGSTAARERNEMVNSFNSGVNSIFLISLKAGGTGLNLTGADVVIHYDPWWNPAVMEQASDRAHRYGQLKAVQIYNIVAKDSIEERIMELQEKKKDLIDSVITQGTSFINKMSEDEIKELFV